jgi:hypothetical protein
MANHPHLLHLSRGESLYNQTEQWFKNGWKHHDKSAHITDIFYIVYGGHTAQQHLAANRNYLQAISQQYNGKAESYLFHGTQRACYIGEDASKTKTCNNPECHMCSIIKCSFQMKHIGANNMLGKGFYTSSVSSKADGYAWNHHIHSKKHALFLGNVVTGRCELAYRADRQKTGPAPGCHSVEAVPANQGGIPNLQFTETVVYREDAILPSIVVMYTRKHH